MAKRVVVGCSSETSVLLGLAGIRGASYFPPATDHLQRGRNVESYSPLGTLWAGLGFGAFYLALLWLNLLLGHFLTPLFLIPLTWLQDAVQRKKKA